MDVQPAEETGLKVKQKVIIKEGLDSESAKKITKLIKKKAKGAGTNPKRAGARHG
jgi:Protein of unknown function (DUF520).